MTSKKRSSCVFLQTLGAIFARIFRDFAQICNDFQWIKTFLGALSPPPPTPLVQGEKKRGGARGERVTRLRLVEVPVDEKRCRRFDCSRWRSAPRPLSGCTRRDRWSRADYRAGRSSTSLPPVSPVQETAEIWKKEYTKNKFWKKKQTKLELKKLWSFKITQRMWNIKVRAVPTVIGALGATSNNLENQLEEISGKNKILQLAKTATLGIAPSQERCLISQSPGKTPGSEKTTHLNARDEWRTRTRDDKNSGVFKIIKTSGVSFSKKVWHDTKKNSSGVFKMVKKPEFHLWTMFGTTNSEIANAINQLTARVFSLIPPTASTLPVSDTSPVMATSCLTGLPIARDSMAVTIVHPALGPSFGVAPWKGTRCKKHIWQIRRSLVRCSIEVLIKKKQHAHEACFTLSPVFLSKHICGGFNSRIKETQALLSSKKAVCVLIWQWRPLIFLVSSFWKRGWKCAKRRHSKCTVRAI